MSLAVVYSRAQQGLNAPLVRIEVHITSGLPAFNIVGLPEKAVKESRERVRSALLYNHFKLALGRITVNLAPADLPKVGGQYDLPIALGLLAAQGDIAQAALNGTEYIGELGLTGELRSVQAILPMVIAAKKAQHQVLLPKQNAAEALLVSNVKVYAAQHLSEVVQHLTGAQGLSEAIAPKIETHFNHQLDFADVCGQSQAKRALEIAAAGGHSVLMQGSPGAGKSMLAQRFISILPPLTEQQALEVASIQCLSQQGTTMTHWQQRPYRSPHHSASTVAIVGGGKDVLPGEISLAHHGVLFLDELPEFTRSVLESLREPLEMGTIHIARANKQVIYPAQFQLIAAMNPCPCGYLFDQAQPCRCTPDRIAQYQAKLSGPLLDRIDLRLEIPRMPLKQLIFKQSKQETSSSIRERVVEAQQRQLNRQQKLNAALTVKECDDFLLSSKSIQLKLMKMAEQSKLSARGFYRIVKVAKTISDMKGNTHLQLQDVQESLVFRASSMQVS